MHYWVENGQIGGYERKDAFRYFTLIIKMNKKNCKYKLKH